MKKIALFFAAALLVAIMAVPAMADTLKIGAAGAFSGDLASYGLSALRGTQYVVEKANAAGGVNGMQVEIVEGDDQCKPELATNVATKLVAEGVKILMGHICSGATIAGMSIYKDAQVIAISPSATNVSLTESGDFPNFFRTIARDDAQAILEVEYAKKLGMKKIACLHDKEDYGKGLAELAKAYAEKQPGMEVVLFEGITAGAVDYSAIIQKVKQSGAEAVLYGGYHPEASKLVAQMRKKKMNTAFISDDGVKDDTFIKVAGEYAEGVYATGPKDTSSNPMTQEATAWHKEKFNEEPGAFFLNGVAATQAMLNAIAECKGVDDYDCLTNALRTKDVATPLGTIRFDDKGDAIGVGFLMYVVKNGVYVEAE